jgi:putative methionine-R-sulfoxide reductase with GAF domain
VTEAKGRFLALLRRANEIAVSAYIRTHKLARMCELLQASVPHYDCVRFYIVGDVERELVLRPFVGEPAERGLVLSLEVLVQEVL